LSSFTINWVFGNASSITPSTRMTSSRPIKTFV